MLKLLQNKFFINCLRYGTVFLLGFLTAVLLLGLRISSNI